MIREVTVSRSQVKTLLNELERIEASDGRLGFSGKERAQARKLLTKPIESAPGKAVVLVKNRQSITARSLDKFTLQLRKAHRELSESKEACIRDMSKIILDNNVYDKGFSAGIGFSFSLGAEVCDTMVYSLRMIIFEGKSNFEVKMEQVSDKIQFQPLEKAFEDLPRPSYPFPPKEINPWPLPIYPPYPPLNPQKEENPWSNWPLPSFPPGEYPSFWLNPWYSPDFHSEHLQELPHKKETFKTSVRELLSFQ